MCPVYVGDKIKADDMITSESERKSPPESLRSRLNGRII
jgi:hypothetical protein